MKDLTAEHRARISDGVRARLASDPSVRERQAQALRGNQNAKGKRWTLSADTRARQSAAWKGKPKSDEQRVKLSLARTGKTYPKLSAAMRGLPHLKSLGTQVGARNKGRPKSPEHRAAISAAIKARYIDPDVRARQVEIALRASLGSRHEYLDIRGRLWHFRSSWELRYAKALDACGLDWDYEPHRLLLSTGEVYVPDFLIRGVAEHTYVELKGWDDPERCRKARQAIADGHPIRLILGLPEFEAALTALEVS